MADDAAAMAQKNAEALDQLKANLESYGIAATRAHKSQGLLEKGEAKLYAMWNKNPMVNMVKQMTGMGRGMVAMLKHSTNRFNMTKKEEEQNKRNMTKMQAHMAQLLAMGSTQKLYNKHLKGTVTLKKKLLVNFLALFGIFLLITVGLAALSIAFQGANSPVLELTENMGIIHDAMQGLLMIFHGEGEGGLASAIDVAAASMLVFAAIALTISAPFAIFIATLMGMVGIFRVVKDSTDSTVAAILAALAVATAGLGAFLAFTGTTFLGLSAAMMLPITIFVAGLAALWAAFTGKAPVWIGVVGGVAMAIVAAVTMPVWGIPVAIAAIIATIIMIIYRCWDDIMALLGAAKDWVLGSWWRTVAFFALVGAFIVGWPIAIGVAILATIWKYRDKIAAVLSTALTALAAGKDWLYDNTIGALLSSLDKAYNGFITKKDEFMATLGGVGDAIMGVIGLENFPSLSGVLGSLIGALLSPLSSLKGLVNNWIIDPINSIIGFSLPLGIGKIKNLVGIDKIPHLARGGIVTGPTTARIGEEGPEAVIPLSKTGFGSGLGGSMTVNINVSGVTDRTDKRRLAREISDILAQEMRRQGGATTRGHF
tara:strand:+ start:903 stop:2693 length:1791 start_codon:yes stop_codon:yes gene_type:complete